MKLRQYSFGKQTKASVNLRASSNKPSPLFKPLEVAESRKGKREEIGREIGKIELYYTERERDLGREREVDS